MSAENPPPFAKDGAHPAIDSLVYDERRNTVGEVKAIGYRITLRPQGGGREWEPEWEHVRPATETDRLASRVRASNRANGSLRAAAHPEIRTLGTARDPDS